MYKKFIRFTGSQLRQHSIDGKRNLPLHKMRCIESWTTLPSSKSNGLGGHQLPAEVIWHMPKDKVPCGSSWPNGPHQLFFKTWFDFTKDSLVFTWIYISPNFNDSPQTMHPPPQQSALSLNDNISFTRWKSMSLHSSQAGPHGQANKSSHQGADCNWTTI